MLKLAQEGMRNVGRHIATTGTFADLGGKPPGNGGGQLLSPGRFTHVAIIPMVGSLAAALLAQSTYSWRAIFVLCAARPAVLCLIRSVGPPPGSRRWSFGNRAQIARHVSAAPGGRRAEP